MFFQCDETYWYNTRVGLKLNHSQLFGILFLTLDNTKDRSRIFFEHGCDTWGLMEFFFFPLESAECTLVMYRSAFFLDLSLLWDSETKYLWLWRVNPSSEIYMWGFTLTALIWSYQVKTIVGNWNKNIMFLPTHVDIFFSRIRKRAVYHSYRVVDTLDIRLTVFRNTPHLFLVFYLIS